MLKDLCVCEILDKQGVAKIRVYTTKKKFKKLVTIVEGIDKEQIDQTAKELKHKLACGGTSKEGVIILQGDQKRRTSEVLKQLGYPADSIEVT
ncbi:Translation initiation factor SUI1 [Candidatus Bilamarchaeum dharawalense]|uniref:Translation initiation factor SUI1 n=1 Tax=Candidatus Bilamarchaeum dharawalense TaxID=2885759 RepID=A0A5E4LNJ4_9ARCH|nr:Translation initiation factor SUI1 [Candidatus Bilamarchaeum dharawalense]